MNKLIFSCSLIAGIIITTLVMIRLFYFYAADLCLDMGGAYNRHENSCSLGPGINDNLDVTMSNTSLVLAVIMGLVILAIVTYIFYKILHRFASNRTY